MGSATHIHWVAPVSMISAVVAGILFAIGHHLFYAGLAGTKAPTGSYSIAGAAVSRQQLNTAVGTAFGFLVKSFLTIAVSTAFVQALWRAIRVSNKGATLASLDGAFALLSNLLGLCRRTIWMDFRMPLLLAIIAWCVPIASIITPATLSVQNAAVLPSPSIKTTVPNFDFTNLNFAAPMFAKCFEGPSQPLQRVVAAVAAQGQILPIQAPGSNATWDLNFWGPSLRCHDVGGDKRDAIWSNILEDWADTSKCQFPYGYLAWVSNPDEPYPFTESTTQQNTTNRTEPLSYGNSASFYVATIPQMFNFMFMDSPSLTSERCRFYGSNSFIYSYPIANDVCLPGIEAPTCYGPKAWTTGSTLLRCDLMNTSYHTQFKYVDGAQTIRTNTDSLSISKPIVTQQCFNATEVADFRLLSYQSISYAFNDLLVGSITRGGQVQGLNNTPGLVINSKIATTILMDTEEMAFVNDFNGVNETYQSLQMEVQHQNRSFYHGLSSKMPTGERGSLKSALETLFQNVTLSILAEKYLQPDYSSPFAPEKLTNVTLNNYHNIYVYSALTLWVAYGIAILFTLLSIGIGLYSMMLNNASFSHDFSTILRTVRTAPMSTEVHKSESDGRQPLPKRLGKSRIFIGSDVTHPKLDLSRSTSTSNNEKGSTAETFLLSHGSVRTWPPRNRRIVSRSR